MFDNVFPFPNVLLDLYPYCNASCAFCSYHHRTRKIHPMPDDIIHKVVDEIGASGDCIEIMPYYYGEILMNPTLFETCDYISEHAPRASISISTNGSLLTPEILEKLLNIKTLGYMNFSAYAGTRETYEKLMGLDYSTLDKIKSAIEGIRNQTPGCANDCWCYSRPTVCHRRRQCETC